MAGTQAIASSITSPTPAGLGLRWGPVTDVSPLTVTVGTVAVQPTPLTTVMSDVQVGDMVAVVANGPDWIAIGSTHDYRTPAAPAKDADMAWGVIGYDTQAWSSSTKYTVTHGSTQQVFSATCTAVANRLYRIEGRIRSLENATNSYNIGATGILIDGSTTILEEQATNPGGADGGSYHQQLSAVTLKTLSAGSHTIKFSVKNDTSGESIYVYYGGGFLLVEDVGPA